MSKENEKEKVADNNLPQPPPDIKDDGGSILDDVTDVLENNVDIDTDHVDIKIPV